MSNCLRRRVVPVGLDVVRPSKELDLPGSGGEPLNHAVDLVWFVAGGADLSGRVLTLSRALSDGFTITRRKDLPRPRWRHSPNLGWSPACFPSRPPEHRHKTGSPFPSKQSFFKLGLWEDFFFRVPGSAPSRGSASVPSGPSGWFSEAGWFWPKWFHPHARSWGRKKGYQREIERKKKDMMGS